MSYEVINEELKIAKCSITDLTIGQVHNFLESWGDDSKIGTLTMFYDREKELLVLNEDTVCFDEYSDSFPYVMKHMSPYFIIECKNETTSEGKGKTPSNTYFHKLAGIMDSNNAKIGIIVSRGEPSKEDMIIAHDNFLLHKNTNCPKFLLSFSENDLEKVIDKRQNLLQYMNYKMNVLTMNAKNPTYDMLEQENK